MMVGARLIADDKEGIGSISHNRPDLRAWTSSLSHCPGFTSSIMDTLAFLLFDEYISYFMFRIIPFCY